MDDRFNALLTGLVVLLGFSISFYFVMSSRKSELNSGNSDVYYAYLEDASGLNAKSKLQLSGLPVGEIDNIELEGLKAKVTMRITKALTLYQDAELQKETAGLMGANVLYLSPGHKDKPILAPGGWIKNVQSKTGTDAILDEIELIAQDIKSITKKVDSDIGGITSDVKGITDSLNKFMKGDGENPPLDELYDLMANEIRRVAQTIDSAVGHVDQLVVDNNRAIKDVVASLQAISAEVQLMFGDSSAGQPGDLVSAVQSVKDISQNLSEVSSALKDITSQFGSDADAGPEGEQTLAELGKTVQDLNRSMKAVANILEEVDRGEGTVGKIFGDEEMATKLGEAVESASATVKMLTSLETHVDLGSWYNFQRQKARGNLGLRIRPREGKYYMLEMVSDWGGTERAVQTTTDESGSRTTIYEQDNTVRITAMFAKEYLGFLELRAGLIENSGGLGANLVFWDRRFELRSDLFDFGRPANELEGSLITALPRWRTLLRMEPLPGIYITAGIDDVLNQSANPATDRYGFDYFVGAGVMFLDTDLSNVLPFIPF